MLALLAKRHVGIYCKLNGVDFTAALINETTQLIKARQEGRRDLFDIGTDASRIVDRVYDNGLDVLHDDRDVLFLFEHLRDVVIYSKGSIALSDYKRTVLSILHKYVDRDERYVRACEPSNVPLHEKIAQIKAFESAQIVDLPLETLIREAYLDLHMLLDVGLVGHSLAILRTFDCHMKNASATRDFPELQCYRDVRFHAITKNIIENESLGTVILHGRNIFTGASVTAHVEQLEHIVFLYFLRSWKNYLVSCTPLEEIISTYAHIVLMGWPI